MVQEAWGPFSPSGIDSWVWWIDHPSQGHRQQGCERGPMCCREPVHHLQWEQVRAGLLRLLSLPWLMLVITMVTRGWKL